MPLSTSRTALPFLLLISTLVYSQMNETGPQLAVDCGRYVGNGESLARRVSDTALQNWLTELDSLHCRTSENVVRYENDGQTSSNAMCEVVTADPTEAFTILVGTEELEDFCS